MKKVKRIRGGKNQLPEEIIHHIQSLLSGKEAARTTMLSKSWHAAYLTRPNLDFSCRYILKAAAFVKFMKDTLQRYDESNINIQSFRVLLDGYRSINVPTAKKLILKAMALGPTDVSIGGGWTYRFPIPGEIFGCEALERLSLDHCGIDLQDQKVNCSRLKYLRLSTVDITGITFWDIISMCPLIEELILSKCCSGDGPNPILLSGPELGIYNFRNMKVLSLNSVRILDKRFFVDLSSRFPCLEDLSFKSYMGDDEIEICSNSLECISFTEQDYYLLRVVFDVPRLRKFVYCGFLPSLSFRTVPEELESDITIVLKSRVLKTQWFLELREFLMELNPSGICLHHEMNIFKSCKKIDIEGLPEPPIAVENLKMWMEVPSSLRHALLDGIFKSCRPSFVDLYWCKLQSKFFNEFTEFVCKLLISESGEKQSMSALHDLEEVNVEFFKDGGVKGCRPLPYKTLSDAVAHLGNRKIKVCLHLKWGGNV